MFCCVLSLLREPRPGTADGNAANVAHAVALLQPQRNIQVLFGTKLGSDAAGQTCRDELQQAGVVLQHELFQVVPDTTTAFTTIIVSASEHTRTCIHTPGTCGDWTREEMQSIDDFLDRPFFDPDAVTEDDPQPIRWFADLVKNDYAAAETLYAGAIFVVMVIVSQELLRMQIYGDGYIPFQAGVKPGQLF